MIKCRHIVCLTFDFDAMTGFVARGMTTPTPISRGEFGVVGVRRIIALLADRGIRSTFFIPGTVIETYPGVCESILAHGHEIAHHGWTHRSPSELGSEKEEADIIRANESIRRISGSSARGYRSPAWDLSPDTIRLLLAHGFVYDSSMMGDDYQPYRARQGDRIELEEAMTFGQETRLIEMPVSWSLDDYPHFEFIRSPNTILQGLANARSVLENWTAEYDYMRRDCEWGVLTYTFHPFVIGRGHRMCILEALIDHCLRGEATFLTMEQAALEYAGRQPVSDAA